MFLNLPNVFLSLYMSVMPFPLNYNTLGSIFSFILKLKKEEEGNKTAAILAFAGQRPWSLQEVLETAAETDFDP